MSRCQVSFEEPETADRALSDLPDNGSEDGYFTFDDGQRTEPFQARAHRRASLSIRIPPAKAAADMAFTALQYLPHPIMVLSSAKIIVLANESMGRLLGIDSVEEEDELPEDVEAKSVTDLLYGVTLSQLGFDLLQAGNPVFMAWDEFLECLVDDASSRQCTETYLNTYHRTPTGTQHKRTPSQSSSGTRNSKGSKTEVHDAIVDVVFSTKRDRHTGLPLATRHDEASHVQAQMIVSVWATDEDVYLTLTFTSSGQMTRKPSEGLKTTSRTVSRHSTSLKSGMSSESSETSSGRQKSSIATTAPTSVTSAMTSPRVLDFLPKGPPGKPTTSAPTMFSKTTRLKDAILNTMNIPAYAMWKDESFGVPNKAAIKLIYPWIEDGIYDSNEQARDFLAKFILWNEDFTAEIQKDDYPIFRLMREKKSFDGYRVGMYSPKDGSRLLFDTFGETITDDKGDFLGGLVMFKDVTDFARTIDKQQKDNEMQFENLCNLIPVMVWRADPQGLVDYLSERWVSYTGMTIDESIGSGWINAVHPDDMAVAGPKWTHSLSTGDEYLTEYRLKRADGEWRWMLGRAVPMKDADGTIVNWFGTCTDIHDLVQAREEAKQTHAQLERVIEHARITLWAIDKNKRLILFEGKPMWDPEMVARLNLKEQYRGMHVYDILKSQGRQEEIELIGPAIDDILAGKSEVRTFEVQIKANQRWFKSRLFPLLRHDRKGGIEGESYIDGVVGIAMDITELRKAAEEVEERNKENARLMAQSVAAQEASKMKSQFLANMSHEIRTPIAGVIGMSELLLDDGSGDLSEEQKDCATNIQRSANALLTVINDILDFSKVESGRLDIEEVQFDLNLVVQDVNKMLGFAAERKGLKYIDDIQEMRSWKVMGDPGRLRQVMTNLLTNSIKFTSEGSVTLRVKVQRESSEVLEVYFEILDTGVGIEDEVRKKLFTPFSQGDSSTHRRFGGTGLGLTISKNLVELMHGEISLESRIGAGTKAMFWVPFRKSAFQDTESQQAEKEFIPDRLQSELSISRPGSDKSGPVTPTTSFKHAHQRGMSAGSGIPATEDAQEQLSEDERKDITVLVVEDNAVNQQIALKTIKKLGFPAKAVWNGKEAIDYLKNPSEENPRPDVLLMDCQMPIMDGYHATSTIRSSSFSRNPEIQGTPIVAMTASAIQGDREKCESAGMDDYLAKPVKKPQLENMLIKWAIEGRRRRAQLAKKSEVANKQERPAPSRNPSSFLSESPGSQDQLSSQLDRLEFAQRAYFERTTETASDVVNRQQQQEEKAISLRDGVLKESGEDPKTRLGRIASEESYHHDASRLASTGLTAENLKKFAQNDRMARLKKDESGLQEDVSSVGATVDETASAGVLSRVPTVQNGPGTMNDRDLG